jgi:hypothetical protein
MVRHTKSTSPGQYPRQILRTVRPSSSQRIFVTDLKQYNEPEEDAAIDLYRLRTGIGKEPRLGSDEYKYNELKLSHSVDSTTLGNYACVCVCPQESYGSLS